MLKKVLIAVCMSVSMISYAQEEVSEKKEVVVPMTINSGTVADEKIKLIKAMIDERFFSVEQLDELKNRFISEKDNVQVINLVNENSMDKLKEVDIKKIKNDNSLANLVSLILVLMGFIILFYSYIKQGRR